MATKDEISKKLNSIINDLIDLSVMVNHGSWDNFEVYASETYPGIYSDEGSHKNSCKKKEQEKGESV